VVNAEAKWVLENEHSIIQNLVGKLPNKFLVQLRWVVQIMRKWWFIYSSINW